MKQQQDAQRFKIWEKNRRDRFNELIQQLAETLPGYEDQNNPKSQDLFSDSSKSEKKIKKNLKWSKAEVLEKAAFYIRTLKKLKIPQETVIKIKNLKRQNKKLRELVRQEFNSSLSDEQFLNLSLEEIKAEVAKVKCSSNIAANGAQESEILNGGLGSEVFVAPLISDDHSYSLKVQDQIEVEAEEVVTEEVIETEPPNQGRKDSSRVPDHSFAQDKTYSPSIGQSNTMTKNPVVSLANTSMTSIHIIPMIPATPQPIFRPLIIPNNFLLAPTPPNKLPLPRLTSLSVKTTDIHKVPKSSVRPLDTKKKTLKSKSKGAGENQSGKKKDDNKEAKKSTFTFSDVTKVDSNLPKAILASEDPEEIEESSSIETIDLTRDEAISTTASSKGSQVKKTYSNKERKRKALESLKNNPKKSKDSYSIAALCKLSANIGEDHAESQMINSPGMVSLISGGTGSPIGTPVPTPTPPIARVSSPEKILPPPVTPLKESDPKPKIIQELSPPKSSPKESNSVKSQTSVPTTKDSNTNSSAVKPKTSEYKIADATLDKLNAKELGKSQMKITTSKKDLSVFDFPDNNRAESPVKNYHSKAVLAPNSEVTNVIPAVVPSTGATTLPVTNPPPSVPLGPPALPAPTTTVSTKPLLTTDSNCKTTVSVATSTSLQSLPTRTSSVGVSSNAITHTPLYSSNSTMTTSIPNYTSQRQSATSSYHYQFTNAPVTSLSPNMSPNFNQQNIAPDFTNPMHQSMYHQGHTANHYRTATTNQRYAQQDYNKTPTYYGTRNYPLPPSAANSTNQYSYNLNPSHISSSQDIKDKSRSVSSVSNVASYDRRANKQSEVPNMQMMNMDPTAHDKNRNSTVSGSYDRRVPKHPTQTDMQLMQHDPGKGFSVTQLVSEKQQQQQQQSMRKGNSKKVSSNPSVSKSSKHGKSHQDMKDPRAEEKKSSSRSRSSNRAPSKSAAKPNYSAETLISNSDLIMPIDSHSLGMQNAHHMPSYDMGDSTSKWGDPNPIYHQHSITPALPFSSISPSPGNLIGQDMSGLDLSMLVHDNNTISPHQTNSKGYNTHPSVSKDAKQQRTSSSTQSMDQYQAPRTSNLSEQQYLGHNLFDNNFLSLSTFPPPTNEENYSSFVNSHHHSSPNVPPSNIRQSSTSNYYSGVHGSLSSQSSNSSHLKFRHQDHINTHQMISTPMNSAGAIPSSNPSSSVSNFDLRTIVPEISHEKKFLSAPNLMKSSGSSLSTSALASSSAPPLPNVSMAMSTTSTLGSSDVTQLTTDILPHPGFAILGSGSHPQMPLSSVANVMPGLNFSLPEQ